ncbi:hypothetical protein RMAECT_0203 [Rickettsia rhipicephali str. Ect]|uniref:Uncharacterized protein n=1 Tax=Rickettsia rhipicephali str. Ect TaxID=1359199 RepID=A0A0F3PIH8_RICRH|nr:hypothetical protein RMAECT_0203 [Rickettsia rhipicephali str. Ect]
MENKNLELINFLTREFGGYPSRSSRSTNIKSNTRFKLREIQEKDKSL